MELLNSQVRVEQIGDSLFLRIPPDLAKEENITVDSLMNLEIGKGKVRITPTSIPEYDLDEMLKGMTPEHFHTEREIDTGPPVGKEIW